MDKDLLPCMCKPCFNKTLHLNIDYMEGYNATELMPNKNLESLGKYVENCK